MKNQEQEQEISSLKTENSSNQSKSKTIKRILKNRSFLLVISGHFFEMVGGSAVGIAIMFLVYSSTQSPSLIGILQTVTVLPSLLLAPFAGVIVDRMDQRKIMIISLLVRLATAVGLVLIYIFQNSLIFHTFTIEITTSGHTIHKDIINSSLFIFLLIFVFTVRVSIWPFFTPAKGAYTKLIVEKPDLLVANSIGSTLSQVSFVIGPIISGILVAISYTVGFAFAIGTSFLSIGLFILLLFIGKKPENNKCEEKTSDSRLKQAIIDLKVGIISIKDSPKVSYLIILLSLAMFSLAGADIMWPVILQGEMNLNSTWYGAMESVLSAAGIVTALVMMIIGKMNRKAPLMTILLTIESMAVLLMAFIRNPWVMVFIIMVPWGIVQGLYGITLETLIQEKIDYEKQGRVFAAEFFLSSFANFIGLVIITIIAGFVSPKIILFITGGLELLIVIGGFIYLGSKKLFTNDALDLVKVSHLPEELPIQTKI